MYPVLGARKSKRERERERERKREREREIERRPGSLRFAAEQLADLEAGWISVARGDAKSAPAEMKPFSCLVHHHGHNEICEVIPGGVCQEEQLHTECRKPPNVDWNILRAAGESSIDCRIRGCARVSRMFWGSLYVSRMGIEKGNMKITREKQFSVSN